MSNKFQELKSLRKSGTNFNDNPDDKNEADNFQNEEVNQYANYNQNMENENQENYEMDNNNLNNVEDNIPSNQFENENYENYENYKADNYDANYNNNNDYVKDDLVPQDNYNYEDRQDHVGEERKVNLISLSVTFRISPDIQILI